jgi:MFS family permease
VADRPPTTAGAGALFAVYVAGISGLGIVPMSSVVVPLWAVDIGTAPVMMGLALGARSLLLVFFSIHGGALIDRMGTRRMYILAAGTAAIVAPLYPVLPTVAALITLQLILGLAQGIAWMSAQTRIALIAKGDSSIIGRFTFVSTLGNVIGPPVAGAAWDLFGATGAFAVIGITAAAGFLAALAFPRGGEARGGAGGIGEILPKARDYVEAFRLTRTPSIAFVVALSCLMTAVYNVRHSFYTVYLKTIDFSGTEIGLLFGIGSIVASLSGLAVGPMSRRFPAKRLLLTTVAGAAVGIAITPLFDTFASLLALACFWGINGGLAFPLILHVLARSVGPEQQGMSVGIRTTVNRTAGFGVPLVMGALLGATGMLGAFLILGAGIVTFVGIIAVAFRRMP